jgi:integrase
MDWGRLPYHVDLYREDGAWKFRLNEKFNVRGFKEHRWLDPVHIGPATGPERLTRKEANQFVWGKLPLGLQKSVQEPLSSMTVVDFVENVFVPEHVAIKGLSGRTHYRAILKHILTPEEVQHIFKVDLDKSKIRLTGISDWPYLSQAGLAETQPEHVERLILAAVEHGYSAQTVTHIRNVVSAIFSHARKRGYLTGANPARQVAVPDMTRKEPHTFSLPQMKAVLERMRNPEKEMALLAILTGMNVAEICGLQWKYVNLWPSRAELSGESVPPRTIMVRKQWYRGELNSVKIGRTRDLPIGGLLIPMLIGLSRRAKFTSPDDFVLVSEAGTPVNETNIASRRLKGIGQELGAPWLSWQVFLRTRKDYMQRFGTQYESRFEAMVNS